MYNKQPRSVFISAKASWGYSILNRGCKNFTHTDTKTHISRHVNLDFKATRKCHDCPSIGCLVTSPPHLPSSWMWTSWLPHHGHCSAQQSGRGAGWPRFEPEICLFVTLSKKLDCSNSQFPCPSDRNHFQFSPHPLSCWVKVEWSNRHANTAHIPNNRSAFYSPPPLTGCQKGFLSFVPSVIQYLMGTSSTGLWGNKD